MQNCSVAVPGESSVKMWIWVPKVLLGRGWLCRLLGILTVPAGPVARAGSLVAKDAVEPVAVLSALWRIWGVGC